MSNGNTTVIIVSGFPDYAAPTSWGFGGIGTYMVIGVLFIIILVICLADTPFTPVRKTKLRSLPDTPPSAPPQTPRRTWNVATTPHDRTYFEPV